VSNNFFLFDFFFFFFLQIESTSKGRYMLKKVDLAIRSSFNGDDELHVQIPKGKECHFRERDP
jgi:hypothetical protein